MIGLGDFLALSLAKVRSLRADYLVLLINRIVPQVQAEVAEEQYQLALYSIFSKVVADWFQLKSKIVTPDYAKDIWRFLEQYVFPVIGKLTVQKIKARALIEALDTIKARECLKLNRHGFNRHLGVI